MITLRQAIDILGLISSDTEEDIRKKYRKQAAQNHPDRFSGRDYTDIKRKEQEETFKKIGEALEVVERNKFNIPKNMSKVQTPMPGPAQQSFTFESMNELINKFQRLDEEKCHQIFIEQREKIARLMDSTFSLRSVLNMLNLEQAQELMLLLIDRLHLLINDSGSFRSIMTWQRPEIKEIVINVMMPYLPGLISDGQSYCNIVSNVNSINSDYFYYYCLQGKERDYIDGLSELANVLSLLKTPQRYEVIEALEDKLTGFISLTLSNYTFFDSRDESWLEKFFASFPQDKCFEAYKISNRIMFEKTKEQIKLIIAASITIATLASISIIYLMTGVPVSLALVGLGNLILSLATLQAVPTTVASLTGIVTIAAPVVTVAGFTGVGLYKKTKMYYESDELAVKQTKKAHPYAGAL